MESPLSLVVEWVSIKEMKALQGARMRTSTVAREQTYEGLLSCLDDRVWKELSQRYLLEKKKVPPCEPKLCRESFHNRPDEFPVENSECTKRFCNDDCRIVRKKENVPICFKVLDGDKESLEKAVTPRV